tara:strand:- start:19329 stop:21506 length:2178 start_codon:yes stop_codon:yes gene_type:complete
MSDTTPTRGELTPGEGGGKTDLHARALAHADEAWRQEFDNVSSGRDCQRFYVGGEAQWDTQALQDRKSANRPALTMNRCPGFVRQLTGEVRQNPPSIKVLPSKDGATIEAAEIFNGLIRNIEQQSIAKAAYTKATENAAQAGIGGWRVVTKYSSDDSFDQDIRIERINDPFQILIDPLAQAPDKSDMRYGFVFEDLAKEVYAKRYPKVPAESLPTNVADQAMTWRTINTIKVAEYWYREPVKKTLQMLEDGTVRYADDEIEEGEMLAPVSQEREVTVQQVRTCLVSGAGILEGPTDWAGRYIPICVVVGEEIWSDGRAVRKGMIHDMRDPQRVYNYTRTAAVEAVSMQPKAPFILTADQASGYESQWSNAGTQNLAALFYKGDPRANGAPQRSAPPLASQGLDVQSQLAVGDLEGVAGIYKAGLGAPSNETSGRAIMARQQEGDTGTYLYIDNLGIAIQYCGKILVDLIPRIYDSTRIVRTLGEDGSAKMVKINETALDQTGMEIVLNDLSAGEYDVTVSTGPSFATKRAEATAFMTELLRGFPALTDLAGDIIIKNMDVPGADEITARIREAKGLDEEGKPKQGEEKVDPVAQAQAAKDTASAMKDGASTDKIVAETTAIELGNAQMYLQMQEFMSQLPAILSALQQATQGGQSGQPGGQGAMPEQGMPMPGEQMPPMGEMPPMDGGGLPPMEMAPDELPPMGIAPDDDGLPPTIEIGGAVAPA